MTMNKRLKVVFMGTPEIAVSVLTELHKHHDVVCVYTKEPAPAKRGHKLLNSPVHEKALELAIPVRYPKNFKAQEEVDAFTAIDADIAVVCAYGLILPDAIINCFKYPCINVHVSMLPKYRGAAPIERAIINGDTATGVTIMKIVQELDAGDILLQEPIIIPEEMNVCELYEKVTKIGAALTIKAIDGLVNESITPVKQDENLVSYAKKVTKEEYKLDFSRSVKALYNLIRGVYPYAYFEHKGERIVITCAGYEIGDFGAVGCFLDGGCAVAADGGKLLLKRVKRAGKNEMAIEDFLRGYSFAL